MTTCHCDGPPHQYTASWCREGKDDRGQMIRPDLKPVPTVHPWDRPDNGGVRC